MTLSKLALYVAQFQLRQLQLMKLLTTRRDLTFENKCDIINPKPIDRRK